MKKKILLTSIVAILGLIGVVLLNYNNSHTIIINKVLYTLENSDMISMMIETELNSGVYDVSTDIDWPDTTKYEFNSELSSCENGGTLTWDDDTNTLQLTNNISDKCYVYFDIIPPDVTITTNNTNLSTYNASTLATLSCTDATSSYSQKYQAIEISDITSKYATCTLTYSTPSTKTYLNDYVTSLAGTTSGNGEVVDEGEVYYGDYSSASTIDESEYGTVSQFYSSSESSTSGTSTSVWSYSNGAYTSDADSMTSGTYYHLSTTVQTSGYYQVCYTMTAGYSGNYLYVYVEDTAQGINGALTYIASSNTTSKSGCVDLGYIESGTTVKFTQKASSNASYSIASMSVYLQLGSEAYAGDAGIRYEGKEPNNYVWFNNELWRIIGVFDESSHGVTGQNLVKIIKATELDGYAWHKSNTNDWTASSLNNLLNNYYYYGLDGTDSGYCYGYSNTLTKTCNYGTTGISDSAREMIEKVTWYLGGYSTYYTTTEKFFGYERTGDYVYSGRATSPTGYIGLMYASDYGYSVLSSSCDRSTFMYSYNSNSCAGSSWLYGVGHEWTITQNSSSSIYVFSVSYTGNLGYSSAISGNAIRPVLYLDSSVYIVSGTGTESNPIILA